MALDSLTDLDTAMLDLEQEWWLTAGKKKDAIHDLVGMTPTRYYQRLTRLCTPRQRSYGPGSFTG